MRRRAMTALLAAAVAVLAARAASAHDDPLRPPVADEAHGMAGTDRAVALAVLRSHYQNLLEPLEVSGLDRKDPSRSAACEIKLTIDPGRYRPGSFVDGLPVRRAQPIVFNDIQQQLVGGLSDCASRISLTTRTWQDLESRSLALLLKNSGTTFCSTDDDCYGAEARDLCGTRGPVALLGSNSTDAVFFIAYRKFLPYFMTSAEQMVNGSVAALGGTFGPHGCPMAHWEERPLKTACVQRSCRVAAP